jgi:hypothetical protein
MRLQINKPFYLKKIFSDKGEEGKIGALGLPGDEINA